MINQITDGIAAALNAEFGAEYEIYSEDVEQGLTEPCFFITCVSPKIQLFRDRRYYRENLFMVQYFPEGPEYRNESMAVQERLYLALESIMVDSRLINGTGMESEYINGILHFKVNYNTFADKAESDESMNVLTQQLEVKG